LKSLSVDNIVRLWCTHNCTTRASIVPICTPARRQRFLKTAAAMWSSRSGTDNGTAENRYNLCVSFWAGESLQKLLKDETCRKDRLARLDHPRKRPHLHRQGREISPERKGPHAGVDKNAQSRARSAL
jgi:hypothetical protein